MRKVVVISLIAVAGLSVLALGSRALNNALMSPPRSEAVDDLVTVGLIANQGGSRLAPGRELRRGVELWLDRIERSGGIRYNSREVATVRLLVAHSRGASEAAAAARRLIGSGATVLFGPPNPQELIAVSDVAQETRTMLLSPIPRPLGVSRLKLFTFLDRPRAGNFDAALDVIDLSRRSPRIRRIAILAGKGEWGLQALAVAAAAESRGYEADVIRAGSTVQIDSLRRGGDLPAAIFAAAPFELGYRWYRSARLNESPPWVLATEDIARTLAFGVREPVAVTAPWSPTTSRGGPVFPPGSFDDLFAVAYGHIPTADAAAGAALGITLGEMVQKARSTDSSRLLEARDELFTESLWSTLSFEQGEQRPVSPYLVLLGRNSIRGIWPTPAAPRLLRLSMPPRAPA